MLNKKSFFGWLLVAGVLFNAAALLGSFSAFFSTLIVFGFLITVPGLLLMLLLKVRIVDFWRNLIYAVCLSLGFLMGAGLLINWLLPMLGITEPLRAPPLLISLDVLLVTLGVLAYRRTYSLLVEVPKVGWKTIKPYLAPIALPILAALGATSLNNNGPNFFTIVMLLGVLVDFLYVFKKANDLPKNLLVFHIFCWGLALLLMTSLRGWLITGHDIQREFYVFQLAEASWHWDIANFKDPYNACLSITILPTMLVSLVNISDSYVYKLLFQIIFALCPVAVYLLARGVSNRRIGLLSVLFFIGFPTFFTDMPMLNRQEIAFMLFAGMLLVLADRFQHYAQRMGLFVLFGAGIVVAHYSTTYSLIAILGAACTVRWLFERDWFRRFAANIYTRLKRPMPMFITGIKQRHRLVIFPVVIVFIALAFMWNTVITGTSKGLFDTVKNAIASIGQNVHDDLKSSDTKSSLFGGVRDDPEILVRGYIKQQEGIRADTEDQSIYYPKSAYSEYTINAAKDQPVPLTVVGEFLQGRGWGVYDMNYSLRQSFAKVLQVLVILGLFVLFFSKRHNLNMGTELTAISLTSIAFLLALVFVPVLSSDYGLLRAFQQVLIVLALPTVLGCFFMLSFLKEKLMIWITVVAASFFFITTTGLVAEATGGYVAQLHLHNAGQYYNGYYIHSGEVSAMDWLGVQNKLDAGHVQVGIEADRFAVSKFLSVAGYDEASSGIYPGTVRRDSYVYLGYNNVTNGSAYALYNNNGFIYNYPLQFLEDNKNLLYSSGQAKIYR